MGRKIKENFFINALFTFESKPCECHIQSMPTKPGLEPIKTFVVGERPLGRVRFAFAAGKGLIRVKEDGTVAEDNILGKFLSIKNDCPEKIIPFLESNGFLLPLGDGEFHKVSVDGIDELIFRMKAALSLQRILGSSEKSMSDPRRIEETVFAIISLVCGEATPISVEESPATYSPCEHPVKKPLEDPSGQASAPSSEDLHNGGFVVREADGEETTIDVNFYNDVLYGECGEWSFPLPRCVAELFFGCAGLNSEDRNLIDALFHYFREVGAMVFANGAPSYCDGVAPKLESMSASLKRKVLRAARHVLKEEMDHNVKGIIPVYDGEKLEPKWKVGSLLDAMYFSIFYLRPSIEIMRQCSNPSCGNYFVVSRTDSKKKYCCDKCRNRTSQKRHRNRHGK